MMDFVAAISAATLSIKYVKNQIRKTCELSRVISLRTSWLWIHLRNQAPLKQMMQHCTQSSAPRFVKKHFKLGEFIALLRSRPNLSHAEKLDVWSNLFNSGMRVIELFVALCRMLFIASCLDSFIRSNGNSPECNATMMGQLEYYKDASPQ